MRRLAALTGIFLATIGLLAIALVASAAPAEQPAGPVLRLNAGEGDGVVSMNGFNLPDVRVARGTTIIWTVASDEDHTITFLAGSPTPQLILPQPEDPTGRPLMFSPEAFFPTPAIGPWDGRSYLNSSPIGRGQDFTVTFSTEGRFPYLCLFHPHSMTGTVEVVAPGGTGITTQADVDRSIATHTPTVHQPQIDQMLATRTNPDMIAGPAGSTTWFVRAGTDWRNGHLDLVAFLPGELEIRQGDTVVWYVDHAVPHTVTFPVAGAAPPDFVLVQLPDGTVVPPDMLGPPPGGPPAGPPDPALLPRLIVGPAGTQARPSPAHDGVSYYNSGLIGEHLLIPPLPKTWALTFDTPGEYEYVCVLHAGIGMVGKVIVLPRS